MKRLENGFSLVELIVTVAILAIVLAIGLPAFSNFMAGSRLRTGANDLVVALNLARHEAVRLGQRVTICKSTDGASCSGTGGWEQGYIVFIDNGTIGTYDGTDQVIRSQPGLASGYTMSGNGNVDSYVSFNSLGAPKLASNALQSGTFSLCGPTANKAVVMSTTGRIRVSDTGATCS